MCVCVCVYVCVCVSVTWQGIDYKLFEDDMIVSKQIRVSIIITKPTNALIVCNLFLNHFFKTLSLASLHEKQRTQMQDMLPQQY